MCTGMPSISDLSGHFYPNGVENRKVIQCQRQDIIFECIKIYLIFQKIDIHSNDVIILIDKN